MTLLLAPEKSGLPCCSCITLPANDQVCDNLNNPPCTLSGTILLQAVTTGHAYVLTKSSARCQQAQKLALTVQYSITVSLCLACSSLFSVLRRWDICTVQYTAFLRWACPESELLQSTGRISAPTSRAFQRVGMLLRSRSLGARL